MIEVYAHFTCTSIGILQSQGYTQSPPELPPVNVATLWTCQLSCEQCSLHPSSVKTEVRVIINYFKYDI